MRCPSLAELPPAPAGKTGWPWFLPNDQGALPNSLPSPLPSISIVMPCFNAAQFIEEALRAVLLQNYPEFELIVIDGGSTDGTVEVIKRYEPWLKYWASEKDRGQSHAINKGLVRTTGELFNWANADDIMCPNAFMTLADLYLKNPKCAGVFGAMEVFDEKGYQNTWHPIPGDKEEIGVWGKSAFLPQPAALFPCQLCKDIGGVNEALHYVMDVDLILRLADHGPFAVTKSPTYRFRHHQESKTVRGNVAGMVELIAAEFNLGMSGVAEKWLAWRMEGQAKNAVAGISDEEIEKVLSGWSYRKLSRYIGQRLMNNIKIRFRPLNGKAKIL